MGSGRVREGERKERRERLIDCKELAFGIVGTISKLGTFR